MEQTIMSKLLDGQEKMNDKLTGISERTVRVEEVVRRHDEVTFPEIQKELKTQSNALYRMESKQNKDIIQFNESKEELGDRIKPLEADLEKRQKTGERVWDIVWRNIERFSLWAGLILFSWLYTNK